MGGHKREKPRTFSDRCNGQQLLAGATVHILYAHNRFESIFSFKLQFNGFTLLYSVVVHNNKASEYDIKAVKWSFARELILRMESVQLWLKLLCDDHFLIILHLRKVNR